MATMRTYGDGCGIAHALDLVGERWALLVVRELLLGPKRFTDLRAGLHNASPNVLSQRLRELEQAGVIQRRKLPPPAASTVYELTDWGRELKPIAIALGTWALRSPTFPRDAPVGTDTVILALSTFFDADAAGDLNARYEIRLGEHAFQVHIADRQIDVDRGAAVDPDAIIDTDPETLADSDPGPPPGRRRTTRRRPDDRRRPRRRDTLARAVPAARAGHARRVALVSRVVSSGADSGMHRRGWRSPATWLVPGVLARSPAGARRGEAPGSCPRSSDSGH